jgi:hypothetical protein
VNLILGGVTLIIVGALCARYGEVFHIAVQSRSRWRRVLYAQSPPWNRRTARLYGATIGAAGAGLIIAGIVTW